MSPIGDEVFENLQVAEWIYRHFVDTQYCCDNWSNSGDLDCDYDGVYDDVKQQEVLFTNIEALCLSFIYHGEDYTCTPIMISTGCLSLILLPL
jgi:hypothetical protein